MTLLLDGAPASIEEEEDGCCWAGSRLLPRGLLEEEEVGRSSRADSEDSPPAPTPPPPLSWDNQEGLTASRPRPAIGGGARRKEGEEDERGVVFFGWRGWLAKCLSMQRLRLYQGASQPLETITVNTVKKSTPPHGHGVSCVTWFIGC